MTKQLRIKDQSTEQQVEISLAMTAEGDVDSLANAYYIARIDAKLGKLVLYSGLDPVELGMELDNDGRIKVTTSEKS